MECSAKTFSTRLRSAYIVLCGQCKMKSGCKRNSNILSSVSHVWQQLKLNNNTFQYIFIYSKVSIYFEAVILHVHCLASSSRAAISDFRFASHSSSSNGLEQKRWYNHYLRQLAYVDACVRRKTLAKRISPCNELAFRRIHGTVGKPAKCKRAVARRLNESKLNDGDRMPHRSFKMNAERLPLAVGSCFQNYYYYQYISLSCRH